MIIKKWWHVDLKNIFLKFKSAAQVLPKHAKKKIHAGGFVLKRVNFLPLLGCMANKTVKSTASFKRSSIKVKTD